MREASTDDSFASSFLGGQNAYEYFAPVAENIKIAPLSSYDQGCVELIQNAFSDYFQGNVDFRPRQGKLRDCHHGALSRHHRMSQWPE